MSSLISPQTLHEQLPITQKSADFVEKTRAEIIQILNNKDDRLMVIVGPCSIHNSDSAIHYAEKLHAQIKKHQKSLCIVMRAYLEKARTSIGWKGLINDPHLNNTFEINDGLQIARSLLRTINDLGVPVATEILNPFVANYYLDLISWAAIGARTTESQIHREFASGLPMPIGFKNNTSGNIQAAIDAMQTASQSHHFVSLNLSGKTTITQSSGNPHCHIVLRGSNTQSNYDIDTIQRAVTSLKDLQLLHKVMVDCSHGNAEKDYTQQMKVVKMLANRIQNGDATIGGIMIESHLIPGKQAWNPSQLSNSDQSITDACIGWAETEIVLETLSDAVQMRRKIT